VSKDSLRITGEDLAVINETLRTGDLNIFTSRYMCLPNSGTMWMPGNDAVGHYRAAFRYDLLYDAWKRLGRPEDQLVVTARAYQYNLRVVWDGVDPTFLLPHGYMFLDWVKPVIDPATNLALIITGTGTGKCLPGRSIVSCADGTRKRIDELQVGDKLVGVDGSYRMAEQTVVSRWSNGLKPLLRVVTSNGTTIDCTPNHPLLKATGWVEAGKIAVGDRVGLPRSLPSSHKEATVTLDEAKVIGYLLGDGGLTDASARFTNSDVLWDRVVSIESIPAEETFDIEVTPDHNFVADGFYTHNTSSIAVAALTYCVLYPGFHFMNLAPTGDQATLMMEEAEKWITNTPYEKFIRRTRTGELFKMKPQPKITISSPLGPKHPSWFVCQTVGLTGDSMLGKHEDWTNIDEVQLVDHIEEVVPKVVTRSRGQRSSGSMRWSKLTMLTNPGPNPALLEIRKLIEKLQADPDTRVKAIFMKDIDSRVNVNISDRQHETMTALMDASDRERWLGGLADAGLSRGDIPTKLIERCESDEMTTALKDGKYEVIKRDGMGIIHYEIPPDGDHEYIVVGDPGMGNPVKKSLNNIPIVLVFDITDFLTRPARLVYFSMIDGMNEYKPWLSEFRNCMLTYSAKGYYDATNLQQAFESAGAFDGGIVEDGKGGFIKVGRPFDTTPVTFAVNNKRWARGTFVMLMQDGQFEWPHLDTLWHQAAIYKETGEGHLKLADDILAAMFVYTLALRIEGALWEKMAKHYHWDAEEESSGAEEDDESMFIARPRSSVRIARNRRRRGRR